MDVFGRVWMVAVFSVQLQYAVRGEADVRDRLSKRLLNLRPIHIREV